MVSKGFFKRMLPFIATFAIGLFIASFFVSISAPRFGSGERHRRYHELKRLRIENEELRNESLRLRNELENRRWTEMSGFEHDKWIGPGPELPVEAPPPPRVSRSRR